MTDDEVRADPQRSVAVAYIHGEMRPSWVLSMFSLRDYDITHNARTVDLLHFKAGTGELAQARNEVVAEFLASDKADWLWWIDTDMGFCADTIDRLFEVADPAGRPIVGALCFSFRDGEPDGMGGYHKLATPTLMDWTSHDGAHGFAPRWDYPRDTVTRVSGTGSACILIHRAVLERIYAEFGPNWYTRSRNPSTGQMISEDLSFCVRALALDIPIHVHTGVPTSHAKEIHVGEVEYWQQRAVNPAPLLPDGAGRKEAAQSDRGSWATYRYAVIPTHDRPRQLVALVASLSTQCDHIVILDNASSPPISAGMFSPFVVTPGGATVEILYDQEQPPHLSRFWNVMLDAVAESACGFDRAAWDVAILNDDALVPSGWYDACSTGLRSSSHSRLPAVAHTAPTRPKLVTELTFEVDNRMAPHAFVTRGELGLRADESMRWWYFDTDFEWQARRMGGVLSVDGPRVINMLANTTTVGPLAAQAQLDQATFEKKWADR